MKVVHKLYKDLKITKWVRMTLGQLENFLKFWELDPWIIESSRGLNPKFHVSGLLRKVMG